MQSLSVLELRNNYEFGAQRDGNDEGALDEYEGTFEK